MTSSDSHISPPTAARATGTRRGVLPRPCIVDIREGEHEPGWLGRRFADSFEVARQTWRERASVRGSMLRWSGLALLALAVSGAYLGSGTSPGRALVGGGLALVWALGWLVFIGLHLSGLRDSKGQEKSKLGLPNGLTMMRGMLIPAVAWAILAYPRLMEHAVLASVLIFLVGFSDVLDGLIARLMRWETILGRNLDPMTDVLICTVMAVVEHIAGLMPGWLMGLIEFRYLGAGLGGVLAVMYLPNARIKPSWIGRLCTAWVGMTLFLTIAQPLLAPGQKPNMVYLFAISGVMLVMNVVALIVMTVGGIAVERLQAADPGQEGGASTGSRGAP